MDTDALRQALKEGGLTEYQIDVYLTLLEVGSAPVVTIAEHSSVPAAQVYSVVRSLEDQRFVDTIERDKLHARAREPVDILEHLRTKSQMLADAADEIEERWERPTEQDYRVNILTRRETVVNNAREAIENADVSVEVAATVDQFDQLQPALWDATERGVVTRVTICGDRADLDPRRPDVTQLRWRALPGPFLVIVDRRRAFFAPAVYHGEPYGMVINDNILTLVLHWFHLTLLWLPCEQLYIDPDRFPTYISIEEFIRDVAPLWHDGVTVRVRVFGQHPDTGEDVEIIGDLEHIMTDWTAVVPRDPTITELSGYATLVVSSNDRTYTVGGWGAIYEDIESVIITVERLEFPQA